MYNVIDFIYTTIDQDKGTEPISYKINIVKNRNLLSKPTEVTH
jgi:hypothetical protein